MSTKLEKMASQLNENYRMILPEKFTEKFGLTISTTFNIFTMSLISTRDDGQDFSPEQAEFIMSFESGYLAAMNQVHE